MAFADYWKYYFSAKTKYQVHSPFVFEFVEQILEDDRQYYYFSTIENYRKQLYAKATTINTATSGEQSLHKIAKSTAISPKMGRILFKIANQYHPQQALELGTSLGIATLYQSTPSKKMKLYSLEENAALANMTQALLLELGLQQVQIKKGSFEKNIPSVLAHMPRIDLVTMNTFVQQELVEQIIQQCDENAVLVLNQPYLNKERLAQWEWLKAHPSIRLTLDIYDMGIAFFREEQKEKTHFDLIKAIKKPWAMF